MFTRYEMSYIQFTDSISVSKVVNFNQIIYIVVAIIYF